ncbi:MAG: 23S rRNA (uracil(1939)-C(5))-methyltransferase RlmD [Clostridia bacterium]|nr:23S rRNA (uracil(1939)-C(5))-methyltransferase RlmD [Clostridia bacterium]
MKKNETAIMKIIDYSTDGYGIAKAPDGMTVFVPNAAVGDEAEILIVKELKKFCFGKIIDIKTKSNDRTEPDCSVFSRCGGCAFRHINYEAELKFKQKRVADAISRIGGIDVPVNEVLSNKKTTRYRNKGQYPVSLDVNGDCIAGFYSLHSHRVIPCDDCILQPQEFSEIVETCINFFNEKNIKPYNEQTGKGVVRHIYLRYSSLNKKVVVCIVINAESLPFCDELAKKMQQIEFVGGFTLNINKKQTNVILGDKCKTIFGEDYIVDSLLGVNFKISPLAFFQVNREMTEVLYKCAASFANVKGKTVLDLFCGAGTIGLTMANETKQVIGVEIVPEAIENAKENAKLNGITNARFICDTAANAAKKLADEKTKVDVVVVDPPRKGLTNDLIDTICNDFSPERVVYVSCDPGTLARDLKIFDELGYKTQKIQPVDLFPRTAHVETVCLMERK